MINIGTMFWILVLFFAIIGAMRGWTKEVIAMSGLILALFTINQFGGFIMGFVGGTGDVVIDTVQVRRQIFYIFSIVTWMIAFFSYQGPAIAGGKVAARLRVQAPAWRTSSARSARSLSFSRRSLPAPTRTMSLWPALADCMAGSLYS